ncbi:MAG: tRNA lysidine(34) synthetase TilS [Alphaproteobacteria bacterium]|nr:tRNA lysidine(34) synthetase TilS [Alphaproteobacteria bacterium]
MDYDTEAGHLHNGRCLTIMRILLQAEFETLMAAFSSFETPPIIAVATSGGPDSLALALLAHQWATARGGKAIALTVDHQLRKESRQEAEQVKAWMTSHAIEHHILTWVRLDDQKKLESAIQATARQVRYQLLGDWCKENETKYLLTAHHAQDQLETFMIRLAKGSGLKGLTGIQAEVRTDFGRILRPLLQIDPECLKETLRTLKQDFIQDPSNENRDFTRIRWRKLLPSLAGEGLTPTSLQETLERLNDAQKLIDQYMDIVLSRYICVYPQGYATLQKDIFQESVEGVEEAFKRILATIGTRNYPVRRKALREAIEALKTGKSMTLGGCQIINKEKEWLIVREPVAVGIDVEVERPGTYLWDERFKVDVPLEAAPCRIASLGDFGVQNLNAILKKSLNVPSIVLKTLPALWKGEELFHPLPSYTFTPRYPLNSHANQI